MDFHASHPVQTKPTDRHFAALLVATIFFIACNLSTAAATPPNIILLMGDDHGREETGYNGHPHIKTPVLDEIAATGLRLITSIPAIQAARRRGEAFSPAVIRTAMARSPPAGRCGPRK